ncbi:MAG: threonine synthase [Oscillospiraceae bacterium]|jgi:threonine synthase|nr:threonine synthase [Oscillospiraceae bacterium]
MKYLSTRDPAVSVTAAQAIVRGISAEGGLFLPESIPSVTPDELRELCALSYVERAERILAPYLSDFSAEELADCVRGAYGAQFAAKEIAPLAQLDENTHMLELFHGPTCAFKDMALQLLPRLLTVSAKKTGAGELVILVATSGDTGKAALEGFRDVPGTRVLVFYPSEGVSPMQRLQMVTQEGGNVGVCAVRGNFDDAQTGVKEIFTDGAVLAKLAERSLAFSSANSINWGRLAPQIAYYFSAYCDLVNIGSIRLGDKINFVVPTGNFGNILAAYYAREMGLPIGKLICASNQNRVLTDFLQSGTYNARRSFFTTISPSMDILISSNLERLLFLLSGKDTRRLADWMRSLRDNGEYTVPPLLRTKLQELFWAGSCGEEDTRAAITRTWRDNAYLCDPHTAVGVDVLRQYRAATGDTATAVVAATASPFKFVTPVLEALGYVPPAGDDEFSLAERLAAETAQPCPSGLLALRGKPVLFPSVCSKGDMRGALWSLPGGYVGARHDVPLPPRYFS